MNDKKCERCSGSMVKKCVERQSGRDFISDDSTMSNDCFQPFTTITGTRNVAASTTLPPECLNPVKTTKYEIYVCSECKHEQLFKIE
ncbi:hypothetical protein [Desulfatibacillum aliphaticivorans]|uniref:hypothetical protein n=1 Tax=Desulfatibacillum aliphaticivorans TaxID=218208 RepID=UPI0012F9F588|nr:hypothetical protein [Desulfatibacillum aliphaticivorans]